MPQDPSELKTMPLYRDVDRIYNELREAGLDGQGKLSAPDLASFDQYHYHGTEAVDVAIDKLGINADSRILEIGSGIGGPARHLAATTGAQVTALEIQQDLNDTALDLTQRCGLAEQVNHVCADALSFDPGEVRFDAIVSWLAFFHIEQRETLLANCHAWLQQTGRIFVEDLYARGEPTTAEKEDLAVLLYSRYLPNREQYETDFQAAGFSSLQVRDMSDDWRQFTHDRYADFCGARQRHEDVHGAAIVGALDTFYGTVARLFAQGNLGGLRVLASKQDPAHDSGVMIGN